MTYSFKLFKTIQANFSLRSLLQTMRLITLGLIVSVPQQHANASCAIDKKTIYDDARGYLNRPASIIPNTREIHGIGGPLWANIPSSVAPHTFERIDWVSVEHYAQKISPAADSLIYIDIESWAMDVETPIEEFIQSRDNLLKVVLRTKRIFSNRCVGLYSLVPIPHTYIRGLYGESSEAFKAWKVRNDLLKPLVDAVDFLAPSFYTASKNESVWREYTTRIVAEARRISSKPVIPFAWPRYHDSANSIENEKNLSFSFIPASIFVDQVKHILTMSDGIIIWDWGNGKSWPSPSPSWLISLNNENTVDELLEQAMK